MATHPQDTQDLREVKRELEESLQNCDDLLHRARQLLLRSEQDNDPPALR